MLVPNKTHYYCRYSRPVNVCVDQDSFGSECSRRQAFFQRLFFEHKYTKMVQGQSFFLTCTYNNAAIPMYHLGDTSFPCFNYDHIRLLTNGALSKVLARKYGSRLRYFCACESGEGKGKRGLGNNPHYHFIFNVQPLHVAGHPDYTNYKLISERDFVKLVQDTWQGDEWKFQRMRFGMAKPGKLGALISEAGDAFSYVGKYVTKSVQDRSNELRIQNYYYHQVRKTGITHEVLFAYYQYCKSQICNSHNIKHEFIKDFRIHEYNCWRRSYNPYMRSDFYQKFMISWYQGVPAIDQLLDWFNKIYVLDYVRDKVNEYRNKFSGKVRLSKSYGDYGLHFVFDVDSSPKIRVVHSGTEKTQTPCLFYLRKLYYDVKICPYTGNPLYVLTSFGREVKCNQLASKVKCMVQRVKQSIAYVVHNRVYIPYGSDLLNRIEYGLDSSDPKNVSLLPFIRSLQTDHSLDLFESSACYCYLKDHFFGWSKFDECITRYAYFKIVYENRVFFDNGLSCYLSAQCKFSDVLLDYHQNLTYYSYKIDTK